MDQIPADVLRQFCILKDVVQSREDIGGKVRFEDGKICEVVGRWWQTFGDGSDRVGGHGGGEERRGEERRK